MASVTSTTGFQNSQGVAANVGADGTTQSTDPKTEFLNLLVTQLQNQDPLNPVDQKDMLAQLAQFSSLEQMQNLNQTMSKSATFAQLASSSSLIGKTVTINDPNGGDPVSGVVSSVNIQGGVPYLHIGDSDYDSANVGTIH